MYYSLSAATAIFGGFFVGIIPLAVGLSLWLLVLALLFGLSPTLFVKAGSINMLFAVLLSVITNNQSLEGQIPLNRHVALLAVLLFAIAAVLYGVRTLGRKNSRQITATLSQQYQRWSKDRATVHNTATELGHLTARRIKSTMTLSQIERVSAETIAKHPHLNLTHVVPETDILDEIYKKEQSSTFTTPLLERSNSLGKKYFSKIGSLSKKLPSINLLSYRLQTNQSGHIVLSPMSNPTTQNIAEQITSITTIAQIEQLSKESRRPNTVWGKSNIIQRH